jgi:hypothetical protein
MGVAVVEQAAFYRTETRNALLDRQRINFLFRRS